MTDTTSKTCPACFKDIDSRARRCSSCTQLQGDVPGLYRDVPARIAGGVCAAMANHFNWDVTLMRVAFLLSLAVLGPIPLWAYLAVWLMTPFEQAGKAPLTRLVDSLGNLFSPRQTGVDRVEL
jgi:phage shock protein C